MLPRFIPIYFPGRDADFDRQVQGLRQLLAEDAEFLDPVALGDPLPPAEAVVFPQMLGDAYRLWPFIKYIDLPKLIITSEFGTLSMWDWEIRGYLRTRSIEIIAPYTLEQTRKICRALGVRRELRQTKFLVFQDNPGEGFQASIFKRFYWWEDECVQRIQDQFGLTVVKKSFQALGETARAIPDEAAEVAWQSWEERLPVGDVSRRSVLSAVKLYLAVQAELEQDASIQAVGINCLNESHFCDTTPCLAWAMLHEQANLTWGCEADLVSMLTMHLLRRSFALPLMMTNLYPFLMGQAALKHERIADFPAISEPENHLLVAHCGYLGVLPRPYARDWNLRRKVLAIVDDNATAIDARLPEGPVTLVKLRPDFRGWAVVDAELTGYVQYPGSDCLNGGVIRVADGPRLMDALESHHYILVAGRVRSDIELISAVFGLNVQAF